MHDAWGIFPFWGSPNLLKEIEVTSFLLYIWLAALILTVSSLLQDASQAVSSHQTCQHSFVDYVCFQVPDEPFSDIANCIGVIRGFTHDLSSSKNGYTSMEAVLLYVPAGYECVDLSLYKVRP